MSQIIACPRCSTWFRLPDSHYGKTLICPSCLADVEILQPQTPNQAAEFETIVKGDRPGMQIHAADIDPALKGDLTRTPILYADIHTDVKRDMNVGCAVLAVLIGFCVLSIATSSHLDPFLPAALLIFYFLVLVVSVSIAVLRELFRWGIPGAPVPSAAKVIGSIFLSIGTIAALVIFFVFTCTGGMILKQKLSP